MKIILTIIFLASISFAHAEYRVYQYIVKNNIENESSTKTNLITSTLDPTTYQAYNGGSNLVAVDLLRTWICPGNTGQFKQTCDSPYKKLTKEILQ